MGKVGPPIFSSVAFVLVTKPATITGCRILAQIFPVGQAAKMHRTL
jgi:hypothetical protein